MRDTKTTVRSTYVDSSKAIETIRERFPDLLDSCIQLKAVSAVKKIMGEESFNSTLSGLIRQQQKHTLVRSKNEV